jgi:hypothetical protein
MLLVAVALVAMAIVGSVPWELVAGAIGVTAAVDLVAVAGRPAWLRAVAALPFAAIIATADGLPDDRWFPAVVAVAIAGGGALAASTDAIWRTEAVGPVLVAITAAGIYAAVPDTEHALAVLGVALWFAAMAWPWPILRLGPGGAAGSVSLLVWGAAYGSRGRPAALIGAVACLALLAALPVGARLGAELPSLVDGLAPRLRVVIVATVHLAVVLLAARTAGLQSSVGTAIAFSIPPVGIALVVSTVLRPPVRPREVVHVPRPLRTTTAPGGPAAPAGEAPSA